MLDFLIGTVVGAAAVIVLLIGLGFYFSVLENKNDDDWGDE